MICTNTNKVAFNSHSSESELELLKSINQRLWRPVVSWYPSLYPLSGVWSPEPHLGRDLPVTVEVKLLECLPVVLEVVRVELLVGGALPNPGPGHSEEEAADAGGPGGHLAPGPALLSGVMIIMT